MLRLAQLLLRLKYNCVVQANVSQTYATFCGLLSNFFLILSLMDKLYKQEIQIC